jgi:hypothetical protein
LQLLVFSSRCSAAARKEKKNRSKSEGSGASMLLVSGELYSPNPGHLSDVQAEKKISVTKVMALIACTRLRELSSVIDTILKAVQWKGFSPSPFTYYMHISNSTPRRVTH